MVITGILSSTVGFLYDKARDSAAAKLKGGDITDVKIREKFVRELEDIKVKVDGLARRDLLSSDIFLQEGLDYLKVSIDNAKLDEQKSEPNESQDGRDDKVSSVVEPCMLNEALQLPHAMGKLSIKPSKDFESAKKRFEEARKNATEAFSNEALAIKDRISAAELRIVSEILEFIDNPKTAITGCLSFLKMLHGLSDIREMFSVYLNGGLKSKLNKEERVEIVKSIMMINYDLFRFVLKFSSKYSSPLAWPTIQLLDRSYNPIFDWQKVSAKKSMGEELIRLPNELILDEDINPRHSAVNSRGEIIVGRGHHINVISKTGESNVVEFPGLGERGAGFQDIVGIGVDNENNIYVVMSLTTSNVKCYVLFVLDENHKVKYDRKTLDFLEIISSYHVWIAINRKNDIIMIKSDGADPYVYVCDNTGQLKRKFERDSRLASRVSVSDKNEIMIPSDDEKAAHIYTEEGKMKFAITAPKDHVFLRVTFHYVISKIIVLSCVKKKDSYFLLCYSDEGKLESTTFFCKRNIEECIPDIISHSDGPVVVVRKRSITFI